MSDEWRDSIRVHKDGTACPAESPRACGRAHVHAHPGADTVAMHRDIEEQLAASIRVRYAELQQARAELAALRERVAKALRVVNSLVCGDDMAAVTLGQVRTLLTTEAT